ARVPDATTTSSTTTISALAARVPDAPPAMFFSRKDEELLERYGGHFVPTGEGPLVRYAPIDSIFFDKGRVLNDEDFAAIFPAIQRMDPYLLPLARHHLSDQIIDLVNRLRSL